jgi:hypothetical protein
MSQQRALILRDYLYNLSSAERAGDNNTDDKLAGAVPSLAHTLLGAPFEPPLIRGTADWDRHVPATAIDTKDQGTADAW